MKPGSPPVPAAPTATRSRRACPRRLPLCGVVGLRPNAIVRAGTCGERLSAPSGDCGADGVTSLVAGMPGLDSAPVTVRGRRVGLGCEALKKSVGKCYVLNKSEWLNKTRARKTAIPVR